jgi:hypothetical protein
MKKLFLFSVILLLILACQKQEAEEEPEPEPEIIEPVYLLPVPQKVLFYRDGTTVYDAYVPPEAIIDNSFILPVNIDRNSFSIYQEGERIFSFSLEQTVLLIQLLDQDPNNPEKPLIERGSALLVTVPELKPGSSPGVRFGVGRSGITWELILDMEAEANNNTLECNLLASIEASGMLDRNLEYILAKRPEITLISSRNIFLERADAMFDLGDIKIEKNKNTFVRLENGKSTYRLVYNWDANRQERPSAFLYCTNPFKSSISSVRGNLNSNGLNLNRFSSIRLTPEMQFELEVGNQPLLTTYKSVRIQEVEERKNLPYTHFMEYTVTNRLPERAELEISVPVVIGRVNRTQYTFTTRAPDERPGDRMVWKYNLAPGAVARLDFRFDAESKDNPLYREFDHYSNGR